MEGVEDPHKDGKSVLLDQLLALATQEFVTLPPDIAASCIALLDVIKGNGVTVLMRRGYILQYGVKEIPQQQIITPPGDLNG